MGDLSGDGLDGLGGGDHGSGEGGGSWDCDGSHGSCDIRVGEEGSHGLSGEGSGKELSCGWGDDLSVSITLPEAMVSVISVPWVSVSVAIEASVVVMVVEVSAVVITSIGFRLCQGSGGKSENYDLDHHLDVCCLKQSLQVVPM